MDIMPKAAVSVRVILVDDEFAWQERHRGLAALGVRWDECRDVAFDGCFAHGITHVRALRQSHIDAVELDFQFVKAEREDAELALVITIDAVYLRGSNDLGVLSWFSLTRSLRERYRE